MEKQRNSATPGARAPSPTGFPGQRARTFDPLQPPAELRAPYSAREIYLLFKGGELEADRAEAMLAGAARCRVAIDLDQAEALLALQQGERLPELGYHLDDYAREFLDWEERKTRAMVAFVRQLRDRPLLRESVRSGRVSLRAGQTVAPVAKGVDEAAWVERAERETVRSLEAAVRETRAPDAMRRPAEVPGEPVPGLRLVALLRQDEREALDEGLALAARVLPGSTRAEQLEAMSQEWLGSFPGAPAEDDARKPSACFTSCRPLGGSPPAEHEPEGEPAAWSLLAPVAPVAAPGVTFEVGESARSIHEKLLELSRVGAAWDAVVGERLGLAASTVEARAALQKRLAASPALQEARRQKLPYEKLRLLCRLPEADIGGWVARAKKLTVIALRRRLEGEQDARMPAAGKFHGPGLGAGGAAPLGGHGERPDARRGAAVGGQVPRGARPALHRHLEGRRSAEDALADPPRARRRVVHGAWLQPPRDRRAPRALPEPRPSTGSWRGERTAHGEPVEPCIHAGHVKAWGKAPDRITWVMGGESIAPEGESAEG
jgi:hypothetical protein